MRYQLFVWHSLFYWGETLPRQAFDETEKALIPAGKMFMGARD